MRKLIGLILALTVFAMIETKAQTYALTNSLSPYAELDTVTNSGTGTLTTRAMISPAPAVTTTFVVAVTKISGTVGGTITLQGSFSPTTGFKALTTPNTATALATYTAADASADYHWIISGSPYPYYRVSWTGTGTMSASFTAKLFRAK